MKIGEDLELVNKNEFQFSTSETLNSSIGIEGCKNFENNGSHYYFDGCERRSFWYSNCKLDIDDIVKKICMIYGNDNLYQKISKRFINKSLTGEIEHQFMTYKKLKKYFKWEPKYKLEKGLNITINWYLKFLKKYKYESFIEKKK